VKKKKEIWNSHVARREKKPSYKISTENSLGRHKCKINVK
jgi:hypothetical protein